MTRGALLWAPGPDAAATRMGRFGAAHGHDGYAALHAWSVADLDGFWSAVAGELGVRWHDEPTAVLADRSMPGARWFPDGTLNYAEHALARAGTAPEEVAVLARSQTRPDSQLTWTELADQVARCATGLRRLGVSKGDRVVAYLPNIPETLVAFLATASIGAVWASCAPEFGVKAVVDRLAQLEPVVLLTVDGYRYGEQVVDRREEVAAVRVGLPTVRHTVNLPYLDTASDDGWSDLLAGPSEPAGFEPVAFDHPLYVLSSSGTTGLPKGIVHGHGGIVLEHAKALGLHHDLGPGDRAFWFTTTGWMMWNYLVSALVVGATPVLFDGDPMWPDPAALWSLAQETACSLVGVSPPFLAACRRAGLVPPNGPALRQVGATGSPFPADLANWLVDVVPGVQPASISGGTDVCTAFLGPSPLAPVRAGELGGAMLGCAVEAYDPSGQPCPPGVEGELVVTAPMPSMPVGLWGDDAELTKFRATYFEPWPGVWRHGDWLTVFDDGACAVSGRSDATLNRGGIRSGTAELYAVVEAVPGILDSLVVHLEAGDRLVLFVVLAPDTPLDQALLTRLSSAVRSEVSPRHVPDEVHAVPAIPRTLSGKKLELPVKRLLGGASPQTVASRDALANPEAFDWFVDFASS